MTHRPDHLEASRQLMELQVAMMKGAMTLMADGARRFVELSLGVAAPALGALARRPERARPVDATSAPRQPRVQEPAPLLRARSARVAAAGRDYALRMQQDVDSILHAFAMVPDTADRLIRTSALLTGKPGQETAPRARRAARPAHGRRPARRQAAEHAR